MVHGTHDSLVPVGEGRRFSETLREVSRAPVCYAEIPDAQHAFEIFRSVRGHHTLRAVRDFLYFTGSWPWRWTFPAFNVADSCITVGAIVLFLLLWREDRAATGKQVD